MLLRPLPESCFPGPGTEHWNHPGQPSDLIANEEVDEETCIPRLDAFLFRHGDDDKLTRPNGAKIQEKGKASRVGRTLAGSAWIHHP